MDVQLTLGAAEVEHQALMDTARRVLRGTCERMGVRLEPLGVMLRVAEDAPTRHLTATADELLTRLRVRGLDSLGEESDLMALARIGALAILSRIEIEEAGKAHGETPARPRRHPDGRSGRGV